MSPNKPLTSQDNANCFGNVCKKNLNRSTDVRSLGPYVDARPAFPFGTQQPLTS